MDPLSVLERHLGPVETWPTHVIMYMFVEDPTDRSAKTVAEFLYGNCIPIRQAIECPIACNSEWLCYAVEKMHEWFP